MSPLPRSLELHDDASLEHAPGAVDLAAGLGETPRARASTPSPLELVGRKALAVLAIVAVAVVVGYAASRVSVVVIPLVLAFFPAAVLAPVVVLLRRRGVPRALAAALAMLGGAAVLATLVAVLAPAVAGQADEIREGVAEGWSQVEAYLESGPLGLPPVHVDELVDQGLDAVSEGGADGIAGQALGAAAVVAEAVAALLFGLVALFFYLKDGDRLAAWFRDLFPRHVRADADAAMTRAWTTVGAYMRGVLIVGLVDGSLIGIGLAVLGVPLAIPLAVLTALGAFFPFVGAIVAGAIAVLVALAVEGPTTALIVLGLVVVVQQLEGNVLEPVVQGKALALHPMAILVVLTAGTVLLGILGAFLAVPVTAAATRAIEAVRERRGLTDHGERTPIGALSSGAP